MQRDFVTEVTHPIHALPEGEGCSPLSFGEGAGGEVEKTGISGISLNAVMLFALIGSA